MADSDEILVIRNGIVLTLDCPSERVKQALKTALEYDSKRFLVGAERRQRGTSMAVERVALYNVDSCGRLVALLGCLARIQAVARRMNVAIRYEDVTRYPRPDAYFFDWQAVQAWLDANGMKFRPGQREAIEAIVDKRNGIVECPTGWGKSFIFAALCIGFKNAKIIISTKSVSVLETRLYRSLVPILPELGLVSGRYKRKGKRVTCVSALSLMHPTVDEDVDIMLFDECQEAGSPSISSALVKFSRAHLYGFSATVNMRLDGADAVIGALFGPVRYVKPYEDAVSDDSITPITVRWTDTRFGLDWSEWQSHDDPVQMNREQYWANSYRNELIAKVANEYPKSEQTLITVFTIEHALHLARLLPDYTLVYSGAQMDQRRLDSFAEQGLIGPNFTPITEAQKAKYTEDFEACRLKKVIVTTVWNRGVDFVRLAALIRADGNPSKIDAVQISGRTARKHKDKQQAEVRDFLDNFAHRPFSRAQQRHLTYKEVGFDELYPTRFSGWLRGKA